MGPLPIDILTILEYNERIVGMDSEDFLYLMQSLDEMYLTKAQKKSET